jgi:hypothetical protein
MESLLKQDLSSHSHSLPRWATFQYFRKQGAQEISSTTASSLRPTEHLAESTALWKPIPDTLPSA